MSTVINQTFIQEAEQLAEAGLHIRDIIGALGVSAPTYYRYYNIGKSMVETGEVPEEFRETFTQDYYDLCRDFYVAMDRGRRNMKSEAIQIILHAAREKDWKAAAYLLEHLDPDWNKAKRTEHREEVKIVVERND